jgi:putative transposase
MQVMIPLEPDQYYHVFNRGINRTNIFFEERNYLHFLRLYQKYIVPVAETYAYCLLRNHFHLLIRVRKRRLPGISEEKLLPSVIQPRDVSLAFNRLLNAYAKAVNKAYDRVGSLFQHHFGRRLVASKEYCALLVRYIHANPIKHGFVTDLEDWPFSSYHALVSGPEVFLHRSSVLGWFGGFRRLIRSHRTALCESSIAVIIPGDDEPVRRG